MGNAKGTLMILNSHRREIKDREETSLHSRRML